MRRACGGSDANAASGVDTPVAPVFVEEAKWAELRPRALLEKARVNLHVNFNYVRRLRKDAVKREELIQASGDIDSD